MIASLPMYDRAEIRTATDRFWALIRSGCQKIGLDAPETLKRDTEDLWQDWTAPDLLLSQTCGFPFRAKLHARVTLIGTPDFGIEGCPPGYYRSILIASAHDKRTTISEFDGADFAYNDAMSQSGWAAAWNQMSPLGFRLRPTLQTGSHWASAVCVAERRADYASLDAVTWRLIQQHEPALAASLKMIDQTDPTPGLPYITARPENAAALFEIVAASIADLAPEDRLALGLRGLVAIPAAAYLAVSIPPDPTQIAA